METPEQYLWRVCGGKVKHGTRAEARLAARSMATRHGDNGLEAYRCAHCGYWHTGHRPKKKQARAAERKERKRRGSE